MVSEQVAGQRLELVRNPNWSADDDYRPAFLDAITISETTADPAAAARRTLAGTHLLCCDQPQPPTAILQAARAEHPAQLGTVPAGGTRWVALNTSKAPFDNVDVRRAVIAGVDREALRATLGGELAGPIAQGFLPPGIPGFAESGGLGGVGVDYLAHPAGDMALFKTYMLRAAKAGVPVDPATGRYAGTRPVTVVGDNADPGLATSRAVVAALRRLGFRTRFRKVPHDALARYCGVPAEAPDVCPVVGWFKGLADPQAMLMPTFDGAAIKPAANVNYSQLDDPAIDRAMDAAALLAGSDRSEAWAKINRSIIDRAPAIPYVWDDAFGLQSADMRAVMNGYLTTWDLSFSSIR
jgi:peptide/nickel transport system substrate-binding protein